MYSLGDGDEPRYANLVTAKHVDEPIDLGEGRGRVRERPGRALPDRRADHGAGARVPSAAWRRSSCRRSTTPTTSRSSCAGTTCAPRRPGRNSPALAVPIEEEGGPGRRPRRRGRGRDATSGASRPAARRRLGRGGRPAARRSEFSDAVAIQLPLAAPDRPAQALLPLRRRDERGRPLVRRPRARPTADQYVAKGSAAITALDAADVDERRAATTRASGRSSSSAACTAAVGRAVHARAASCRSPFPSGTGAARERGNKRGLTQWQTSTSSPRSWSRRAGPRSRRDCCVFGLELLVIFWVRRKHVR